MRDIKIEQGSDAGKVFRLKKASAYDAEFWAMRAIGGMLRAGVTIPDDVGMSAETLAYYFSVSFLKIEAGLLKELMDEMMQYVEIVPLPDKEPGVSRKLLPNDINDVSTLFKLRKELLDLNAGFFTQGG